MSDYSGLIMESQVDWLTASAHGRERSANLRDLAIHLTEEEKAKGNRTKSWRLMGYEGTHTGAVEWGRRDANSAIIRLIGQRAEDSLTDVLSVADQVTRLDLAVTWQADPPDPLHARNQYVLAELARQKNRRMPLPSMVMDANGGNTFYLGSRESEYFLRVYNKQAECLATGDDEGAERYRACWRWELETKASVAQSLARLVDDVPDRPAYVRDYLASYAQQHGLASPFAAGQPCNIRVGFRRRADADSKLRHLRRNVRPTVRWLREAGYADAVREALELP